NDSMEQSTPTLIINNNPLENSIFDFSDSSSSKEPVEPHDDFTSSDYLPHYDSSLGRPTLTAPKSTPDPFDERKESEHEDSTLDNSAHDISREKPGFVDSKQPGDPISPLHSTNDTPRSIA
ncbi:17167_t:CDS:2, partial [Gigaspora rosea]